jgi:hypothetical protein
VSRFCHGANDWIRHVAGNICCCANGWRYVSFPQHKSLESPQNKKQKRRTIYGNSWWLATLSIIIIQLLFIPLVLSWLTSGCRYSLSGTLYVTTGSFFWSSSTLFLRNSFWFLCFI